MTKIGLPTNQRTTKSRYSGITYPLPYNIPLTQTNCIYLIQCKKCPLQYVGETRNALMTHLSHHTYNIRRGHKTNTHLVQHFQKHGLWNMTLQGLEHNPNWTTYQRKKGGERWIRILGTIFPKGLNERNRLGER